MSDPLNPTNEVCGYCGMIATGYAYVNDQRHCHGDDDDRPTCYELGQGLGMDVRRFARWLADEAGLDLVE